MKKNVAMLLLMMLAVFTLLICTGCTEALNHNLYDLPKEVDSSNVVRKLTVIDCITGDVLFQMSGRMSIYADNTDNQLEIIVENEDETYVKHFVGLSDNVTYVVEDLNLGTNEVNKYKYILNFNPKMWIPVDADIID